MGLADGPPVPHPRESTTTRLTLAAAPGSPGPVPAGGISLFRDPPTSERVLVTFLFLLACCILAGALPAVWGNWRTRSLRRAFASGRAVRVPAEAAWRADGGKRADDRPVRGDLWLAARADVPVRFMTPSTGLAVPRGGPVRDVVPLRWGGFARPSFLPWDTVVYAVPGTGRVLQITVERWSTEIVTKALTDPGDGESVGETQTDALRISLRRRIRVPGFAALMLSGALALGLFGVHTFALGREVNAKVTDVGDAECQVAWQDPWEANRDRHARVDCYEGEKPGDTLRIIARPWPVRGEAADLEDSRFMTVFGIVVAGTVALIGVVAATVGEARRLGRLRDHLRDGGRTSNGISRRVIVPWWSWGAGALGAAGLGLVALTYGFGQTVPAEVTGEAEYGCAVSWTDPWDGSRQAAEVDCERAVRGDALEISALPWPLRGEAFDRDFTPVALGFLTLFGLGTTIAGIALHSRRARGTASLVTDQAVPAVAVTSPEAEAPAEARDLLDRRHLASVSRLLLARTDDGPIPQKRRPEPDPRTGPWWRSPALRRITATSGMSWGALITLVVIGGLCGGWWLTAARFATDHAETATATVERLYDELPVEPWLLPAQAEISFTTADGRHVTADIAVSDPVPAEGDTMGIEHAAGAPSAVRIPGAPGLTRGLWVSGTAAALALARVTWCAVRTCRTLRLVLRAARSTQTRTFDYLVLPGGREPASEPPVLLLFEPGADRPVALMDVEPAALRLPAQGTTEVHSTDRDPAAAVAFVDGRPVWPISPLADLSDEEEEERLRQYVQDLVPPGVTLDSTTHGEWFCSEGV